MRHHNIINFLYNNQPKSSDLLIGIIGILLGVLTYAYSGTVTEGRTLAGALAKVLPLDIWGIIFLIHGATLMISSAFNIRKLRLFATLFGTFVWTGLLAVYYRQYGFEPLTVYIVYGSFSLFSVWSFINVQEEIRLYKLYGTLYKDRTVGEDVLMELQELRKKTQDALVKSDVE